MAPAVTISGLLRALQLATPDNIMTANSPMSGVFSKERVTSSAAAASSTDPQQANVHLGDVTVVENTVSKVSVKARCAIHKDCKCWINVRTSDHSYVDVREAVMNWLSTARALTPAYHELHSEQVRESFGVKPRHKATSTVVL